MVGDTALGKRRVLHLIALGVIALLTACARPEPIIGVETVVPVDEVPGAVQQKVFIATTRQPSQEVGEFYSGNRSLATNYASVVVSVPPIHETGKVERPIREMPDPREHFVIDQPRNFDSKRDFENRLSAHLRSLPSDQRNVMVFVHGYNTDLTSAVLQVSQFVHDSGYDGVPLLFSWASSSSTVKYVYDLNSALTARDQLAEILEIIDLPAVEGFDLVAHSMGTFLVMETSRQVALTTGLNPTGKARNIVLTAPDIDVDLFRAQLSLLPEKGRNIIVLVSKDDKALKASRRVAGGVQRVGQMSATELSELGVIAFDLSEVEDTGSLAHSKFKSSPAVVQLLGAALVEQESFNRGPNLSLGQAVAVGVDGTLSVLNSTN